MLKLSNYVSDPFTISKGTVQFPIDKPFPASLLKKMVKARLAQIAAKKRR